MSEGLPEVLTHCLPGNRPHSGQLHTFLPLEGSGGTHMDLWPIWSTEGGDGWPLSSPWFYYYYFKIFIHLLCLNETKTGLSCSTQGYSILVVAYGIFTCSKQDLVPWPGMEPAPYSQPNPRYTRARAHTHTHTHTHTELWQFKTHTGIVTIENVYRTSTNDSRKGGGGITLSPESTTLFVKTKNPITLESSCRDCWESHTSSQHRIWRFPCKCFFQPHFFFFFYHLQMAIFCKLSGVYPSGYEL